MAKAAVIIPCYNAEDFIRATVQSVLNQSLSDLEVVVVNDGSTDQSLQVAVAIEDPRLQVIDQPNAGVAASRNNGYLKTSAPYVTFLDADDLLTPDSLEKRVQFLEQHPDLGAVTNAHEAFDSATDKPLHTIPADTRNLRNRTLCFDGPTGMLPSSVMMTRDAFETAGQWDPQLSTAADQDLWIRLADVTKVGGIDDVLTRYRIHPGQMHRNIERMKQDVDYLFDKAREQQRYPSDAFYRYCMARKSWVLGASFIKDAKQYGAGIAELIKCLRYSPRYVLDQFTGHELRIPN